MIDKSVYLLNWSWSIPDDFEIFFTPFGHLFFKVFKHDFLGFFAHESDFTDDSFVHFNLSVDLFLCFHICIFAILWLIYFIFSELICNIIFSSLTACKLDEEECNTWILEESLLSLLAVFIHGVSYKLEVNGCSSCHLLDVFLLEVVTQYDWENWRSKFQ